MAGRPIVVQGAELKCTGCPGGKSYLTPTVAGDDKIEGKRPATIKDHQAGIHIHPFDKECTFLTAPCRPKTPTPWADIIFSGVSLSLTLSQDLSPDDKLECTWGGEIGIVDSCQSTVIIGRAISDDTSTDTDDGSSFWKIVKPVLGIAGVAAAADGPIPVGDAVGATLLTGAAVVGGGVAIAEAVSGDDSNDNSDDADHYEETYGDYEYNDPRETKRGPLKGGRQNQRDPDFGIKDPGFWKYWERTKGSKGGDIRTKKEAEEHYDEWLKADKPSR